MTITPSIIWIAAALLVGGGSKLLLVRKRGTVVFMQPGGKINPGETPIEALQRELFEELGLVIPPSAPFPLGRFSAPAANEPGHVVEAEMFKVAVVQPVSPRAEIEEMRWVDVTEAEDLELAPLTRDHLLPLFRTMLWPA